MCGESIGVDRVLVVLTVSVKDGSGAPWVLTGTHRRDAPSRQDDGDIRAPTLRGLCCHGRYTCHFPTHPRPGRLERWVHSRSRHRHRLDQLFRFVLSACSPRFSTHRQLSAHRSARLHAVSTRVGFLSPKANFTCESLHIVRNLYSVTDVLRHMRPLLLTSTRSGRGLLFLLDLFGFPWDSSSAVLSSPGSMIVTFLSFATSPCKRWNLCTAVEDVRPLLRSPSQGFSGNPPGGYRASHTCTNSEIFCCLLNNLWFLSEGPLFVCFICSIRSDGIHNHL